MQYMKRLSKYLIPLFCAAILIGIDQLTKRLVDTNMNLNDYIELIPGIFEFRYIRNSGTAWGMFAGKNMHYFFVVITAVLLLAMVFAYVWFLRDSKFRPLNIVLVILFSGAIGNMIDRIRYQNVIDFLYFKLIDFPIFNVADIYVVVSMFLLAYLLLFKYKDEDFQWKTQKNAKSNQIEESSPDDKV